MSIKTRRPLKISCNPGHKICHSFENVYEISMFGFRPVLNYQNKINVGIGLQVIWAEVQEVQNVFILSAWVRMARLLSKHFYQFSSTKSR